MTTELTKAAQRLPHDETHDWSDRIAKLQRTVAQPDHTKWPPIPLARCNPADVVPQQATPAQVEREAFEAFVRRQPGFVAHLLYRRDFPSSERHGQYVSMEIELAWEAWQARASLPAPEQATPERHLTVTTNQQGEAVMVSWQDDEHRILEVVWERKQATPEPVGEPALWALTRHLELRETTTRGYLWFSNPQNSSWTPLYTRPAAAPAPAVPEGFAQEAMTSKWCWWFGDGERFQIVDTESEAHGEAQSYIDDDADSGEERSYSIARVQHPVDALGMEWLALHVAESIAENVCCWCDDNTGAEEPSIMLSPDDSKALGLMVATFLRQRVGVDWWTADQKTTTQHTYVAGSNDALAAAQAKGADHG